MSGLKFSSQTSLCGVVKGIKKNLQIGKRKFILVGVANIIFCGGRFDFKDEIGKINF